MGLAAVELVIAFEDAFSVTIVNEDAARMLTPRDVIDFIAVRRPDLGREEIAATVRELTLREVAEADYGEDKRYAADMGLD